MSTYERLKPLLQPRTIAVVGASEKAGAGSLAIENLRTIGFDGTVIPVNPKYDTIQGLPCHPSLEAVPAEVAVDCVAILLGSGRILSVLEQAAARGVRGAWAFASGFGETGGSGQRLQAELRDFCRTHGIAFCGPNCVGFANLNQRVATFSAPLPPTLVPGRVGVVAQSGSVILALANSNRGIGFSTLVSSGNEAVLDAADYFEYFLDDDHTDVIVAFLEGIRRPEAFIRACERAAVLGKPIVAAKVGRSALARKTVVTHTGALAGSDRVHTALFRKLGVIRVDDLDQLLETAEALVHCRRRLPAGRRAGVITVSGGEIGLLADLAEDRRIEFPPLDEGVAKDLARCLPDYTAVANPLDAWGSGDLEETYPACLDAFARAPGFDLVVVSQDAPPGMAPAQVSQYAAVARAAVAAAAGERPVVAFSHLSGGLDPTIRGILNDGGVPFLQGTRESLTAIEHLLDYAAFQRRRSAADEPTPSPPAEFDQLRERLHGPRRVVGYATARAVLDAYGIPVGRETLAATADEAVAAAERIGYPVVLKVQSPDIAHRTEGGLVRLGLADGQAVRRTVEELTAAVRKSHPAARLDGILVQETVGGQAVEMIVGIDRDPSFGPVVVLGTGGILVELMQDAVVSLPPLGAHAARDMLASLTGRALLDGFRGRPPADTAALADTLMRIGRMAADLRDVLCALDLNPLMVLPAGQGVCVVDILMEAGSDAVPSA